MEQNHWFDEALKILGWILLFSVVFTAVASGPHGTALLAVVLVVFALNLLIHGILKLGQGIAKAGNATLEAMSKIRITLPKRPPTKKEVANWFLGECRENEEIIDSLPIQPDERNAMRERNRERVGMETERLLERR